MTLLETIQKNLRVLHKVTSVPTVNSATGIYFVESEGIYLVVNDPLIPNVKILKKIYERSDHYFKGEVDTLLTNQTDIQDAINQSLQETDQYLQTQINNLQELDTKKAYATKADADADTNPIGDDGIAIGLGQLVVVTSDPTPSLIGLYRLKTLTSGVPTWEFVGVLGDISSKADHGYTGTPKTLKQVDDELANNVILFPDSDTTNFPSYAILAIDFKQTANISETKEYYIKYLFNTTEPRFLLQIVDENSTVIADYYLPTSNLSGKQWITLDNNSDNLPFADVYIDADKFTSSVIDFFFKLHLNVTTIHHPPFSFEKDSIASQKMAQILQNTGNILRRDINLASAFPFWAIRDIRVTMCDNTSIFYRDGILKDLYLVYLRKGDGASVSTILQIGEKIGSSVGVGLNIFASCSITAAPGIIDVITLNGTGIKLDITIDWTNIISTYSLTTEVPIFTQKLLSQANVSLKKNRFWLNPKNSVFDYSSIHRLEAIKGSRSLLYKTDGTLKELYLTYFRFNLNPSDPITNIIQIAWKDGTTVGVNNKIFATVVDDTRDMSTKPIAEFILEGSGEFNGLEFSIIIDLSHIPDSILSSATIGDTLQLNTLLFVEQLRATESGQNLQNKQIVCFGDSVTEFGNYPEIIAQITGAITYKIGFGGCHLAQRTDSNDYNELGMVKIAESVTTQNFTNMQTAVNNLAALTPPDDNTATLNLLMSINFSNVDFVTIFFGTNDFTSGKTIGVTGSTNTFEITGAINYIINTLLTAYPNLKILFITPTHRYFNVSDDSDLVPNGIGKYLIEYCNAIEEEAKINHIPTLNMYTDGGMNKYNHVYYFGSDNVHPNTLGYNYLAQKISATLNSLFRF